MKNLSLCFLVPFAVVTATAARADDSNRSAYLYAPSITVPRDTQFQTVLGDPIQLHTNVLDANKVKIPGVKFSVSTRLCGEVSSSDDAQTALAKEEIRRGVSSALFGAQTNRSLTAEQVALLNRTPFCAPYIENLISIADLVGTTGLTKQRLSGFIVGNVQGQGFLSLNIDGKEVYFFLNQPVHFGGEGVVDNLTQLSTSPGTTGQQVGVDFVKVKEEAYTDYQTSEETCIGDTTWCDDWSDWQECYRLSRGTITHTTVDKGVKFGFDVKMTTLNLNPVLSSGFEFKRKDSTSTTASSCSGL